jgi:eukaryotic-like serine/threonine-protein kinase
MARPSKDESPAGRHTPSEPREDGRPARSGDITEESTAVQTPDDIAQARAIAGDHGHVNGPPGFSPNQSVGGRYRVIRFIARGAMGEVYEAEDTVLRGRVALKTIRPEIAREQSIAERFKREIALSRRITHPNVCRIYDIGVHEGSVEAPGSVLFLTMELLAGESLSRRIVKRGRLTAGEALPILEQVAAGLDAAHASGVLHRDLKSGNVMLAAASGSSAGERAVVTDFGLARSMAPLGEAGSSLSESTALVGTPAYMAPEQVEGLPLTPAVDQYALGVIAYEMLTGKRPFDGDSAMKVAALRLTSPPPPPRTHVPDLHPGLERAILRCLEREPARRFGSAGEFVAAMRSAVTERATPSRRRWRALAGGGVVLLALAATAYLAGHAPRPPLGAAASPTASPAAAPSRTAVAVLPLGDAAGRPDSAWLSTALQEMVAAALASGGRVRTTPGNEVARAVSDLGLRDTPAPGTDQVRRLAGALTVTAVASGRFTRLDPGSGLLRVDLVLQDGGSGRPIAEGSATGNAGQLAALVGRVIVPLRVALGEGPPLASEFLVFEDSLPRDPAAAQAYAQGLQLMRENEPAAASRELAQAARLAPGHPLVLAALAGAWRSLGYSKRAEDAARAATDTAARLPREARLLVEAQAAEASLDRTRALGAYQQLVQLMPDDPDFTLHLAEAQSEAGRPREALVTLDGLVRVRPADARVALMRARVYRKLGEFEPMLAAATLSSRLAGERGSRGVLASARLAESSACLSLGRNKEAQAAADEARRLFAELGDRGAAARSLEAVALSVQATGDLTGARRLFERALVAHESTGDKGSAARVSNNLGRILWEQGRPQEADRLYERALALFREIGATVEMASVLSNMGARLHTAGDLKAARERYTEALTLFEKTANRAGLALTLTNLGELQFAQAELAESRRLHGESLAVNREVGDKAGQAYDLTALAEIALEGGDLLVADGKFGEAAVLDETLGDRLGLATTQIGQARVLLERGDVAAATKLAAAAEEVARSEGDARTQARALLVTADAALAEGSADRAQAAQQEVEKIVRASDEAALGLEAAILASRLLALSPDGRPASRRGLADIARRAMARGQTLIALEARVEAARLAADPVAGRDLTERAALAAELRRRGLGRLARRLE